MWLLILILYLNICSIVILLQLIVCFICFCFCTEPIFICSIIVKRLNLDLFQFYLFHNFNFNWKKTLLNHRNMHFNKKYWVYNSQIHYDTKIWLSTFICLPVNMFLRFVFVRFLCGVFLFFVFFLNFFPFL